MGRSSNLGLQASTSYFPGRRPSNKGQKFKVGSD